MMMMMMINQLI